MSAESDATPTSHPPQPSIDTAQVIADLKESWDGSLPDAGQREQLEWLCRKIHVGKQVKTRYLSGWKKDASAAPLDASAWPTLIRVMLDYSVMPDDADEDHRGLALKFINAACAGLDLAMKAGVDGLDTLSERCVSRLATLSEEVCS